MRLCASSANRGRVLRVERRRLRRLDGFRIGHCLPADGRAETECLIWNHNEQGALLEFTAATQRFDTFRLRCTELGIDAPCRVVWQDGREWGVEYVEPSE